MKLSRYVLGRLLYFVPAIFLVITGTFFLVRVVPGNPVYLRVGTMASQEVVEAMTREMGLDRPLWMQYVDYLGDLLRGDLGVSWRTSNPVSVDIARRFPATLELIGLSLCLTLIIAIPLGVYTAWRQSSKSNTFVLIYGLVAGALPEFWLGLILILVFFAWLNWAPPPMGRIGVYVRPPETITGMYTIDALLTGNWSAFRSAISQLILPVATLVFVTVPPILRMTLNSTQTALESNYVLFARASGLRERTVLWYAFRSIIPPVLTLIGFFCVFLLGGAVLVETVFTLSGFGQYAVESVLSSDYAALLGFILVAGLYSLAVYLITDIVHVLSDRRVLH